MFSNIPKIRYVACFTEDDGVYSCGHKHASIAAAMNCLVPDGGSFIRAYDSGVFRSLTNRELIDFLESLGKMSWSSRSGAQGGALAVPLAANADQGAARGAELT
jgi:hypothetical protein